MAETASGIRICTDILNVTEQTRTVPKISSQGLKRFKEIAENGLRLGEKDLCTSDSGSHGHERERHGR